MNYLPRLFSTSLWVLAFAAAGFVHLFWQRRFAIPALALLVLFPISFIMPVDQIGPGSGIEMRFALPMLVPCFALAGVGAASVAAIFSRATNRNAAV
jgi:hypothetical protein